MTRQRNTNILQKAMAITVIILNTLKYRIYHSGKKIPKINDKIKKRALPDMVANYRYFLLGTFKT